MSVQTYKGSCQCGAVSFDVEADLDKTVSCNCSRCGRLGSILTFVAPGSFRLTSGEGEMSEYQFNRHMIHHMFCSTLRDTILLARQRAGWRGNDCSERALPEGVDPDKLHPKKVDGASF